MHLAGRAENGWRVFNVVPPHEEFEAFAREQLLPALRPQRTRRLRLCFLYLSISCCRVDHDDRLAS